MNNFAKQLKELRMRHAFTMQSLADQAQVSKSMICKIESGDVQPTLDVAGRLASALNVSLSEMLHTPKASKVVVITREEQGVWEDADHILRRNISPIFEGLNIEWLHVTLPPGASVKALPPSTTYRMEKFLLVKKGNLEAIIGDEKYRLKERDSLYFEANHVHSFLNLSRTTTEYYIVINHHH